MPNDRGKNILTDLKIKFMIRFLNIYLERKELEVLKLEQSCVENKVTDEAVCAFKRANQSFF